MLAELTGVQMARYQLSRKQYVTLMFIDRFIRESGRAPTTDEILFGVGFFTRFTTRFCMKALEYRGFIELSDDNIIILRLPGESQKQN